MEIIQYLIGISILVGLVITLIKVADTIAQKRNLRNEQVLLYSFNMFFSNMICCVAQMLNVIFCWDDTSDYKIECQVTWTIFSISLQVSLNWMAVIIFTIYFVANSTTPDFVDKLTKANLELFITCNAVPLIANIILWTDYIFIVKPQNKKGNFNIFQPQIYNFEMLPLIIPIILIVLIITLFVVMSYQAINKSSHMSYLYKNKVLNELYLMSSVLMVIYGAFITLNFIPQTSGPTTGLQAANQNPKAALAYQIIIICINVIQIPIQFYIFGFNSSIQQIIALQLSLLKSLHYSELDLSGTVTQTEKASVLEKSSEQPQLRLTQSKSQYEKNVKKSIDYNKKAKSGQFQKQLKYQQKDAISEKDTIKEPLVDK